jgi:hypothetical protein
MPGESGARKAIARSLPSHVPRNTILKFDLIITFMLHYRKNSIRYMLSKLDRISELFGFDQKQTEKQTVLEL